MGLFKFVKNAGASLFNRKKKEEATSEDVVEEKRANAFELVNLINRLGLKVNNLDVAVDGDRVTVKGEVEDQATRERVILAVGNVEGVAEVDDDIRVVVVDKTQFHTVVSGETLGKIAKQYYGDAMKYPEIFEANKPMLEHPDKIYVGQMLRIPDLG